MGFFGNLQDFLGFVALENNFLVLAGPDDRIIAANRRYNGRFGLQDDVDPAARHFEALGPEELDDIKAQLTRSTPHVELKNQESLDGYQVFIEWQCYELRLDGITYTMKIGSDVSEREYLRQRLKEIGSVAKVGYWRMDTCSNDLYWSPEVYRIHGVSQDDFVPERDNLETMYCEESWPRITESMRDCVEKGKPFSIKVRVLCDDDGIKHVELDGSPEFNRGGKIIAVSGTFRDRTSEALMETRFSDTSEELRKAQDITTHLENTLDEHALVSIADITGKIIYVNQKFCDVSGYSADELIGQNHRLLKSGEHEPEFYSSLWQTISSGKVWRGEICNRGKSGEPYWVFSTIVPFVDSKTGRPQHYVSVRTDITELKKFQSYQDEMLHKTAELSQAKSEFLANMSHELRTPLNAILGYSEMLQEQYFGDVGHAKYLDYAEYIHSSGERLLQLINDVLDISKIEAGRYEVRPDFSDMGRILDDIHHEFIPMAASARVDLLIENPHKVGNVYVDEKAVKQIIANLVSNAIKFSSPEGQVSVMVRAEQTGVAVIRVKDAGIGMSQRDMEIALSPFGQVNGAQIKSYQGTGLGLPLCKHLTQLHGGEFLIDSELGAGTCVTVRIPTDEMALKRKAIAG